MAGARSTSCRNGKERTAFKEVSFTEYNKGMANWKSKPATMINKVAISQCVRDAFPKDYEGVYSEEEMIASGAIPADYTELPDNEAPEEEDAVITQEQRQMLFKTAQTSFGKEQGNAIIKSIIEEIGLTSTTNMKQSDYKKVVERLMDVCEAQRNSQPPEEEAGENVGSKE